jgi:hypothetical protein
MKHEEEEQMRWRNKEDVTAGEKRRGIAEDC